MYTTPAAPQTYTFNEAAKYAEHLNAEKYLGYDDWRVPTKYELNVLWENRNQGQLEVTFNETGSPPDGWYWSSDDHDWNEDAVVQRLKDGFQTDYLKHCDSALRCVR